MIDNLHLALALKELLRWDGLIDLREDNDVHWRLPPLLFGVYVAHLTGDEVNVSDASRLLQSDKRTTTTYIEHAKHAGWVYSVDDPSDARQVLLKPTPLLIERLDAQLGDFKRGLMRPGHLAREVAERQNVTIAPGMKAAVQAAGDLVEQFVLAPQAKRSSLIAQLPQSLVVAAHFTKQRATVALKTCRGTLTKQHARSLAALFFPAGIEVQVIPGTRFPHLSGQLHPSDVSASIAIANTLRALWGTQKVTRQNTYWCASTLNGTLVAVGGENTNPLTRLLFEFRRNGSGYARITSPAFPFQLVLDAGEFESSQSSWGVTNLRTGHYFPVSPGCADGLLITVLPNVFNAASRARGGKVVVFGGIYGTGTKAVGLLLRDEKLLDRLASQAAGHCAWQAYCRIEVDGINPVRISSTYEFEGIPWDQHILTAFGAS